MTATYKTGWRRRYRARQALKVAAGITVAALLAAGLVYMLAGMGAINGGPKVPAAPACWPCR